MYEAPRPIIARHLPAALGFALGFGLFLPIGLIYLLFLIALLFPWAEGRPLRQHGWPDRGWLWILGLFLAWPAMRAGFGWYEDSGPRLLHHLRIVLTIWAGLTLPDRARNTLIVGGVAGSLWVTGVVLVNQVMPLPDWRIWHNLLAVHGNGSSQKWIALATVAGILFTRVLAPDLTLKHRALTAATALWLALCVTGFSISRNAHLLLLLLPAAALLHRRTRPGTLVPSLVAVLLVAGALGQGSPQVSQRLETASEEIQAFFDGHEAHGSVEDRLSMFAASIEMIGASPVLGHGTGAWRSKWAEHSGADPSLVYNNPHNDFLLWWVEGGLPALGLLLLILLRLARDSWAQQTAQGASGWVVAASIALTAAVNAPFRDAQLGMMLLLIAAAFSVRPIAKPLKTAEHAGQTPR
jgi:O-antigen ligase